MNVLAEQTLEFLCTLMFAEDGVIDRDYWSSYLEEIPDIFSRMSQPERDALSKAAKMRLEYCENEDEQAFCEVVASGEIYSQWCL